MKLTKENRELTQSHNVVIIKDLPKSYVVKCNDGRTGALPKSNNKLINYNNATKEATVECPNWSWYDKFPDIEVTSNNSTTEDKTIDPIVTSLTKIRDGIDELIKMSKQ